jgi:hypothetical protein
MASYVYVRVAVSFLAAIVLLAGPAGSTSGQVDLMKPFAFDVSALQDVVVYVRNATPFPLAGFTISLLNSGGSLARVASIDIREGVLPTYTFGGSYGFDVDDSIRAVSFRFVGGDSSVDPPATVAHTVATTTVIPADAPFFGMLVGLTERAPESARLLIAPEVSLLGGYYSLFFMHAEGERSLPQSSTFDVSTLQNVAMFFYSTGLPQISGFTAALINTVGSPVAISSIDIREAGSSGQILGPSYGFDVDDSVGRQSLSLASGDSSVDPPARIVHTTATAKDISVGTQLFGILVSLTERAPEGTSLLIAPETTILGKRYSVFRFEGN